MNQVNQANRNSLTSHILTPSGVVFPPNDADDAQTTGGHFTKRLRSIASKAQTQSYSLRRILNHMRGQEPEPGESKLTEVRSTVEHLLQDTESSLQSSFELIEELERLFN